MASDMETLRNAVYVAILAKKTANLYALNGFTVEESYMPRAAIKSFPAEGKVYIVGLNGDDSPNRSRTNLSLREVPIQVGLQKMADYSDMASMNDLVQVVEELRDTCRKLQLDEFQWMRNEALRDDNGTPYSFVALREHTLFEAYFTAYYSKPIT